MKTKKLGDIEISAIAESGGPYRDPLEMFPDATQELVDHHRDWLQPGCIDPVSGMLILASCMVLLSIMPCSPRRKPLSEVKMRMVLSKIPIFSR